MFVLVKSIDLYSSQSDPSKKIRWADLWSYEPPSFASLEISPRLTSRKNSKFRENFFEVSTFQSNVCIIHYT